MYLTDWIISIGIYYRFKTTLVWLKQLEFSVWRLHKERETINKLYKRSEAKWDCLARISSEISVDTSWSYIFLLFIQVQLSQYRQAATCTPIYTWMPNDDFKRKKLQLGEKRLFHLSLCKCGNFQVCHQQAANGEYECERGCEKV